MLLRILQELPFLDICHDDNNGWLYAEWRGDISCQSVQEGGAAILEIVRADRCRKLLNDNSLVTDMQLVAPQWQAIGLYPPLYAAGLRYVAWVYSANLYGRFSADQAMRNVAEPVVQPFEDMTLAKSWLRAQN